MMCNKCHASPHCTKDNLTLKLKRIIHSRPISRLLCLRINGSRTDPGDSLSRHGSQSSRGSVRITITNVAEQPESFLQNQPDKLDSPGATSQTSEVSSKSMADRELPKIPSEEEYEEEEHDYDMLYEGRLPPSQAPASPLVDYDTIENIILGRTASDTPDYATVQRGAPSLSPPTQRRPSYDTVQGARLYDTVQDSAAAQRHAIYDTTLDCGRRPSYETLPDIRRQGDRRPSYECLNEKSANKSATIGPIRTSPFAEIFDESHKPLTKSRGGSERRAKDNEDSVSVIYASINPEFRTRRQESLDRCPSPHSLSAPPVPENPYAMLDNLLEDLNLQNPDHSINNTNTINYNINNTNTINYDNRIYEDLENVRPNSALAEELLTPLSGARRTNPIIVKSSPYAVSNT